MSLFILLKKSNYFVENVQDGIKSQKVYIDSLGSILTYNVFMSAKKS